jgi:hypothetical protein
MHAHESFALLRLGNYRRLLRNMRYVGSSVPREGDFDSAIRFEQQAIAAMDKSELNRSVKDPERRRAVSQSAVASYQRRQPWRLNLD